MSKKITSIYADGGLKTEESNIGLFQYDPLRPRGQGYGKVNLSKNERIQVFLPSIDNTNNEAELFAVLLAITICIKKNIKTIYTDSEFVVKTVNREYKVNEERLKLLVYSLISLIGYYQIQVKWISRDSNLAT